MSVRQCAGQIRQGQDSGRRLGGQGRAHGLALLRDAPQLLLALGDGLRRQALLTGTVQQLAQGRQLAIRGLDEGLLQRAVLLRLTGQVGAGVVQLLARRGRPLGCAYQRRAPLVADAAGICEVPVRGLQGRRRRGSGGRC